MDHADILRDFPLGMSLLKAEEGYRDKPYKCSTGHWTIGYGFNLEAHGIPNDEFKNWEWDREKSQTMLLDDLGDIIAVLDSRFPAWREKLDPVREAVVLSSFYQLGVNGALAFKNTIKHVRAGDWEGAAQGIMASRWAKQDPERAQRNADAMRTGILPEVVRGVKIFPPEAVEIVDAAPVQPAPRVVQAEGLRFQQSDSESVGGQVGAGVPGLGALITDVSKRLGKSPAAYGASGLFTMLVGNVRLKVDVWFFDHLYHFEDAGTIAALLVMGLIAWGLGRRPVSSVEGKPNA